MGTGDATIIGGGAQEAKDKVIQHNGAGTVTIKDFTVINAGKLYRSCGDCTNNESKSPRKVIVENIRAYGMTSDLIGINSNFGDEATISDSCGLTNNVCQEYKGVNKGNGSSSKVDTKTSCKGAQGLLETLPACGTGEEPPETEVPTGTTSEIVPSATTIPSTTTSPSATAVPTEIPEAPETTTTLTPTKSGEAPEETEVEEGEEEAPVTTTVPVPSTLLTLSKTAEESTPTDDSSSGTVARWGQCGGKGYTGPTTCASGECKFQNEWYSQCL